MQDKEKVIVEIMGFVSAYGNAVEATVTGKPDNFTLISDENAAFKAIESKLRDFMEQTTSQKPLSDEEIDALWMFCGDLTIPQKVQRRIIVRTAEATHGITKGS